MDAKTGLKNSLLAAASEGNTPLVRVLLKQGADLEAFNEKKGRTPLMVAAGEGHLDLVRILRQSIYSSQLILLKSPDKTSLLSLVK